MLISNVNFSAVVYTIFVFNTHPINRISKAGIAIVNTISSIFHHKVMAVLRFEHAIVYLLSTAT